MTVIVQRLSSGYWHVRFSMNQFIQWPVGRAPRFDDGFGWLTEQHLAAAIRATAPERSE
jgi:hypothetical protein